MAWYSIVFIALAVITAGLYIFKRLTGIDYLKYIALTKPVIAFLASAVEAMAKVWPGGTMDKIYIVFRAAAESTELAEEMWLMGQLPKEQRNAEAKRIAREVVEEAGFEVTPQVELIIAGVIEAVCIMLPHNQTPITEQDVDAQE